MTWDLELRGVTKRYDGGGAPAVDAIDLRVESGEFIALLGPSGCGKTTTLRMVAGFVVPSAGRILLRGVDITDIPPHRRDMGMVFQSYALFPHMTVRGNIEFGLHSHKVGKEETARRVARALGLVGLSAFEKRYPRELSGGQQQRVAVARVLALDPKLLLFDEPLSNLDAKLRGQMRHEIRKLQKEVGVTTLFVTHDQDEAMTMADRVVVLNQGRIEQIGTQSKSTSIPRPASSRTSSAHRISSPAASAVAVTIRCSPRRADCASHSPAHRRAKRAAYSLSVPKKSSSSRPTSLIESRHASVT